MVLLLEHKAGRWSKEPNTFITYSCEQQDTASTRFRVPHTVVQPALVTPSHVSLEQVCIVECSS
jgi:hypothetical protein